MPFLLEYSGNSLSVPAASPSSRRIRPEFHSHHQQFHRAGYAQLMAWGRDLGQSEKTAGKQSDGAHHLRLPKGGVITNQDRLGHID